MLRHTTVFLLLCALAAGAAQAARAQTTRVPPINYKVRTLANGLQVVSAQERSSPTVAIQVWYEVVPSNYLETLLWAEADRMGSLNVNDKNFHSERDVVKEEFNTSVLAPPYGRLFYDIDRDSFTTHPYHRPTIGSKEDLDAATLEDVRAFHSTFYRPDNAVLIVVGDFEQQQLDAWVDKYFGKVAKPSTPIPRVTVKEPPRTSEKRFNEAGPNVPLPAGAITYLAPPISSPDAA